MTTERGKRKQGSTRFNAKRFSSLSPRHFAHRHRCHFSSIAGEMFGGEGWGERAELRSNEPRRNNAVFPNQSSHNVAPTLPLGGSSQSEGRDEHRPNASSEKNNQSSMKNSRGVVIRFAKKLAWPSGSDLSFRIFHLSLVIGVDDDRKGETKTRLNPFQREAF